MAVYQDQVIFQKNRTIKNVRGKVQEYVPCLTEKNNIKDRERQSSQSFDIQMVNVKNILPTSERV